MKPIRHILQVVIICLSLITSVVYGQAPGDTIPESNPLTLDGTPGTINPGIDITDRLIIPCDPYIPSPPVGPAIPMEPNLPSTEKTVVDPKNPGIPAVDNQYTVGSVSGSLTVNGLGAAEYALPIEAPNGGPLMPGLSLVYNSQNATNGIAGYGISLSGLSAITRGEKSIFNNKGNIEGITYTENDNLFLDGKRLILISGLPCQEGALYCIEGDPYTQVMAHGQYTLMDVSTWFEVKTPDGMTYQYGNTPDSRLTFQNNSGRKRIASWHVNRTEDPKGNYMTVSYQQDSYYPYPMSASYGMNSVKDRGLVNKIELQYEDIGATPGEFYLEDRKGAITKRIATITSSSNGQVFRKYFLTYDVTSDKSTCRFARLISIREENGNGDSLTPTKFTWAPLTNGSTVMSIINDPTVITDTSITFSGTDSYTAADINGDGISDIIRMNAGIEKSSNRDYTFIMISRSEVTDQGQIKYQKPIICKLPPSKKTKNGTGFKSAMGVFHLSDIDGDGINDMIFPQKIYIGDTWNSEKLHIIYGKEIAEGKGKYYSIDIPINSTSTSPLYASCDFDGDGMDEVLCLETSPVNGLYRVSTMKIFGPEEAEIPTKSCNLEIPWKPEKVFCGDYNNDGLTDIIVLHKEGYKIFYNSGGKTSQIHFDTSKSKTGITMKDQVRVDQGDFNGDGLLDFVYNVEGESIIWVAYNNGDGTFRNVSSGNINLSPKIANEPDNYFLLRSIDMNRDGRSDILVCKAAYEKGKKDPVFKETQIRWLESNGTGLRLKKSFTKTREADACENNIFIGDFFGDGYIDLANSGSALDRENSTVTEKTLNLYRTSGAGASTGRITGITDGLGNTSDITYSYLTSPDVYCAENHMKNYLRVNTLTLPLPVVKQLNFSNGICRSNVINYQYKDLYVEMTGAGVLGFGSVTKTMLNTGESSTDAVIEWDVNKWIPEKTRTVNEVGGKKSSIETIYMKADVGNTYYSYEKFSTVTDMYGETVTTSNIYDLNKGVLTSQTVRNNGDKMYKKVDYSDFKEILGVWLPGVITMTQKHEHDSKEYSTETKYTYDAKGNVLSTTRNSGTDLELTTSATYDEYGNCLSSFNTGKSVIKITKYNEYDTTGRFLVRSSQYPEAAVKTFTYDIWGNLLTENDCTDPDNILTTTHTYDNWGRKTSTTHPYGGNVKYSVGWGKTDKKHHYSFVEETGSPWVLTWFDKAGNETSNTTFGPKNVLIEKKTGYDSYGKVNRITEQTGKLKVWKSFAYDELGRLLTEKSSSGNEVTYKYGNRTVTTSTNGREYTKKTDAWGNLLSSSDPSGATVIYTYDSNGQPSSITTDGVPVRFAYDCAGNKISVSDPDAGTTTYEYAADGTLLKQTDARGIATINKYDELGRLSSVITGNQNIISHYGTSGNEKLRLTRKILGNNQILYHHDKYGRIIKETRIVKGAGTYNTSYNYDSNNRLSSVVYDGISPVTYTYDDYGFKTAVRFENKDIYRLQGYDGLTMKTSFADSIMMTRTVDSNGLEISRRLDYGSRNLDGHLVEFDPMTLNLLSRERKGYKKETFRYDDLDRLIGVKMGETEIMNISYARNGNILTKTGLGTYGYDNDIRPHAVTTVDNSESIIPSSELLTTFNVFGLIDKIEDNENIRSMSFIYGPDGRRWRSTYSEDGKTVRSMVYANNIEIMRGVTESRTYYLDENVILVKSGIKSHLCFLFKDHLGSILSAYDSNGSKTFEATYDAWGKQEIKSNLIGLRRGYTGHEMINEFGIINMNGRLYDPELGRFFSPDPYVQFPDFSQSYNRYSYCLNNPLKYTDPSGHFLAGTALLIATTLFNIGKAMLHAQATGGNIFKAGLASLLTSPLSSFGIGKVYGSCGGVGKELLRAGTHGLASGLASVMDGGNFGSFASGLISGGVASMFMSCSMKGMSPEGITNDQRADLVFKASLIGGGISLIIGGDFLKGALTGYNLAMFNFTESVPPEIYVDEDGNAYTELHDVIVYPDFIYTMNEIYNPLNMIASNGNSLCGGFGKGLTKYGYNSTYGSNGKLYLKTSDQRAFWGNQYVTTQKLTAIGSKITSKTGPIGHYLGGVQTVYGAVQDANDWKYYGSTNFYNMAHGAASWGASYVGTEAGIYLGGEIGAYIGLLFGGAGAIPGGIIGSAIGGLAGAIFGDKIGGHTVDMLYGK